MAAVVDQINDGTAYTLDVCAVATELLIDPLEEITGLRVDVVCETSEQLTETLAVEDRETLMIRCWVRAKLDSLESDVIEPYKLLARQLFQRLNNFKSVDGRVKVWECEADPKQIPDKTYLNTMGLFVTSILMRVEVEAS
jgi:hypothetical protein